MCHRIQCNKDHPAAHPSKAADWLTHVTWPLAAATYVNLCTVAIGRALTCQDGQTQEIEPEAHTDTQAGSTWFVYRTWIDGISVCSYTQYPETTFTCLYCHHEKAVSVKLDKKEGVAYLNCKICSQGYQSKVNRASFVTLSSAYSLTGFVQTWPNPLTFTQNGLMLLTRRRKP